jgi:hypothetical protein
MRPPGLSGATRLGAAPWCAHAVLRLPAGSARLGRSAASAAAACRQAAGPPTCAPAPDLLRRPSGTPAAKCAPCPPTGSAAPRRSGWPLCASRRGG